MKRAHVDVRRVLAAALIAALPPAAVSAQFSQGQPGTYVIRGGTVVTVTGQSTRADVLVRDGKIAAIGPNVDATGATVIDATGRFVYPGLIDSATDIGISEIGSVPATIDVNEAGTFKPHMRAIIAVNPSSELIAVTRANGVTTAITQPGGGIIAGQAALLRLDGWTQAEMAIRPSAGFVINYPRAGGGRGFGGFGGFGGGGGNNARQVEEQIAELRDYLFRAREYDRMRTAGSNDIDLPLEAMRPLIQGKVPAVFTADTKEQIEGALKLADEFGLKPVISGGDEAWKLAGELARRNVPVVLGSMLSNPGNDQPYDAIYALPGVLHRAGVKIAFSTGDGANARHVPYHAALAVAYGLDPDAALKALTIWPAEIWGVADQIGSIEVGKSADLFIASGDPLDVRTTVSEVFIAGRRIPHDDRHTRLYEKYNARPAVKASGH